LDLNIISLIISTVCFFSVLRLVAGFPPRWPGFEPRSGHGEFVVDKVALGQVFSEFFGFPCQFSFHRVLYIHHHLSSGFGTIGQSAADVPSGLSLTPPQGSKLKLVLQSVSLCNIIFLIPRICMYVILQ
jgi:hypothetical protein